MSAPQAKNLWGFRIKIVWTTLRKHSESMIFEEKIVFSKRKTPKFSRLRRGYTPNNPKIFRACGAATTQAIIQNVSHVIQKVIIQKYWWRSKSNYSKAIIQKDWWRSKAIIQKQLSKKIDDVQKQLFKNCSWSGYYPSNFQICMRLSRSLHMHKTFGK